MTDRDGLRQAHQDALDALIAPVEALVAREIRRILNSVVKDVFAFATLTAAGEPLDLGALSGITNQWLNRLLVGGMLPAIGETYQAGAMGVWMAQAETQRQGSNMTAVMRRIQETIPEVLPVQSAAYLRTAANQMSTIGERSWVTLRSTLTEGLERGESIPELQARARKAINVAETHARTIARTEVIGATNAGSLTGALLLGDEAPRFKEWLATSDGRTRPSHVEADGDRVPLDEHFTVGGVAMQRPHDPGAPAREVANCRCTLTYTDDPPDGWVDEGEQEPTTLTPPPKPPSQAASQVVDMRTGPRTLVGQAADHGLTQIEKVHRIPEGMKRVPVSTNPARSGSFGSYAAGTYQRPGPGLPFEVDPTGVGGIVMRANGERRAVTFVHEYGHYLDHQMGAFGQGYGQWGTRIMRDADLLEVDPPNALMARLRDAWDSSPTIASLRSVAGDDRYSNYLLQRNEMWARSYAQWIATRSGDATMLDQINRIRTKGGIGAWSQWGAEEFVPIGQIFDEIFADYLV